MPPTYGCLHFPGKNAVLLECFGELLFFSFFLKKKKTVNGFGEGEVSNIPTKKIVTISLLGLSCYTKAKLLGGPTVDGAFGDLVGPVSW